MTIEITVPVLPESVTEGTLGAWHKSEGDMVLQDDHIVDLETDKVVLEIVALSSGRLAKINCHEGDIVTNNQVLGIIEEVDTEEAAESVQAPTAIEESHELNIGPAARKLINQHNLDTSLLTGTGHKGAVTKQDVELFIKQQEKQQPASAKEKPDAEIATVHTPTIGRSDQRVPMSRLRQSIAKRLKEAQNSAALLSTFNEVNLKPMMDLRNKYKASFEKTHDVKLGMMSFFTKAVIEGLKRFPIINASIDGDDIVYHDYYDIGIAVSSERGLVVPILRDADQLSYAGVEKSIRNLALKARDGKLNIEDLTGGTFSITNGGVFGSMLSTPILNPPQSAILGMHSTIDKPVVIDGEIVIRPMMYLALTYDHRIIDGKDAVQFLATVKQCLEDPAKILLNI
ncbi:MAG: 2-oxoglutarate dehydrogenase complex dihydrolipoyllysine-residue succinyltransferase [Gammaproteobacteria bacterium]|nr:2-oxoglutarate dehydrogenase complex dihydrolipoyllysine-residue succinyltransferase [Gammaproteobacteria bacterium]